MPNPQEPNPHLPTPVKFSRLLYLFSRYNHSTVMFLSDVSKLADIVVSAKIATYASKVVINNQEQSTGMRSYVSKRFLDVIKNCADGWQAPLKNLADAQQVQVHTAAEFLSGPEQVISGQRRDQLAETNPQAIAMENEGEGRPTAFLQPVFIRRCTQPG